MREASLDGEAPFLMGSKQPTPPEFTFAAPPTPRSHSTVTVSGPKPPEFTPPHTSPEPPPLECSAGDASPRLEDGEKVTEEYLEAPLSGRSN